MLVESALERDLQAAAQLLESSCDAEVVLRVADVVQRMDEDLVVAELRGQLNGARPPCDRLLALLRHHVQLRLIAVGHGQLGAFVAFEHGDGLGRARPRLGVAPEEPVET